MLQGLPCDGSRVFVFFWLQVVCLSERGVYASGMLDSSWHAWQRMLWQVEKEAEMGLPAQTSKLRSLDLQLSQRSTHLLASEKTKVESNRTLGADNAV